VTWPPFLLHGPFTLTFAVQIPCIFQCALSRRLGHTSPVQISFLRIFVPLARVNYTCPSGLRVFATPLPTPRRRGSARVGFPGYFWYWLRGRTLSAEKPLPILLSLHQRGHGDLPPLSNCFPTMVRTPFPLNSGPGDLGALGPWPKEFSSGSKNPDLNRHRARRRVFPIFLTEPVVPKCKDGPFLCKGRCPGFFSPS